jgi:hypothetical protein
MPVSHDIKFCVTGSLFFLLTLSSDKRWQCVASWDIFWRLSYTAKRWVAFDKLPVTQNFRVFLYYFILFYIIYYYFILFLYYFYNI